MLIFKNFIPMSAETIIACFIDEGIIPERESRFDVANLKDRIHNLKEGGYDTALEEEILVQLEKLNNGED